MYDGVEGVVWPVLVTVKRIRWYLKAASDVVSMFAAFSLQCALVGHIIHPDVVLFLLVTRR